MDLPLQSAELRREISQRRGRARFRADLVARIRVYVAQRRTGGATWQSLSDELGIALDTLYRWQREQPRVASLRPVEIVAEAHDLVVHGPCGLRIEGLDLDSLVSLLRKLS